MKFLAIASLTTLLATSALPAGEDAGVILRDPKSGSAVTLPAGWEFAAGKDGVLGVSEDEKALVLLAAVEGPFETAAKDPKGAVGQGGLEVTEMEAVVAVAENERGGFDNLLAVRGKGKRKSGAAVDFEALIVTAGEVVTVAAGAWEDEAHKAEVSKILESLQVDLPKGEGGLQLYDRESGATIQLPEGWGTFASRGGLLAIGPDRGGMAMILRSKNDFAKTLKETRTILRERIFTDITIGEFTAMEAGDAGQPEGIARLANATGKAVDRGDGKPVGFEVLVATKPEEDRGLMVLGAWKNEKEEAEVRKMLKSLRMRGGKQEP